MYYVLWHVPRNVQSQTVKFNWSSVRLRCALTSTRSVMLRVCANMYMYMDAYLGHEASVSR
jgi:hypothetical protein